MQNRKHIYTDGETEMHGAVFFDPNVTEKRPGVLVAHTWAGLGAFERAKAKALAELGYTALALDNYGGGKVGADPEENGKLMMGLRKDRPRLRRRLQAGLDALRSLPEVDPGRTAAIGFCFGGLCVLDLARSGADIGGVVSFHGILDGTDQVPNAKPITAKVLALHGWDDPLATPAQVSAFAEEMTAAGADWQLHGYGHTGHAFTNPEVSDRKGGFAYSESADRRSWQAMHDFLVEVFST